MGVRSYLASGRDHLVDALNGDRASDVDRRNRRDNRHLKLLLRFGLRADSHCLDVGANQGLFLGDFLEVAPKGHHIAYEPIPALASALAVRFPDIEIRQRALSNHDGSETFSHVLDPECEPYSGLSGTFAHSGFQTELLSVPTERLDDHLPEGWLPSFIKIDVEGAEHLVLEGAVATLLNAKPVVALEHGWNGGVEADRSEAIYHLLCRDVGLRLFDMDGNGPLGLGAFLDRLHTQWNWIAHE
jgi:FkbM family methyltransferase